MQALAYYSAQEYSIDAGAFLSVIRQESRFDPHPADGDMKIICKRTGAPVRARGIAQITECYHPEVTDAEAYDPAWALEWAASMWSKGHAHEWSTYKTAARPAAVLSNITNAATGPTLAL